MSTATLIGLIRSQVSSETRRRVGSRTYRPCGLLKGCVVCAHPRPSRLRGHQGRPDQGLRDVPRSRGGAGDEDEPGAAMAPGSSSRVDVRYWLVARGARIEAIAAATPRHRGIDLSDACGGRTSCDRCLPRARSRSAICCALVRGASKRFIAKSPDRCGPLSASTWRRWCRDFSRLTRWWGTP